MEKAPGVAMVKEVAKAEAKALQEGPVEVVAVEAMVDLMKTLAWEAIMMIVKKVNTPTSGMEVVQSMAPTMFIFYSIN